MSFTFLFLDYMQKLLLPHKKNMQELVLHQMESNLGKMVKKMKRVTNMKKLQHKLHLEFYFIKCNGRGKVAKCLL